MSGEQRRPPMVGRYTYEEVALAGRNCGMPLEALRHDLTPAGLHYRLIHFDIPHGDAQSWRLRIDGLVERPMKLSMADLRAMHAATLRVTLECAGNGRAQVSPRYPSVPWQEEGVSTAEWTGVPLAVLLREAGLRPEVRDIVFRGADRGIDRGTEHDFARSLVPAEALREDVLVAWAMNGEALPAAHGYPLRLVVPGWYGMASVKWLQQIEALERPFDGPQQLRSYHFRTEPGEQGVPCTHMRVNSLMAPPGVPDFYSRARMLQAGRLTIVGRAWSGNGVEVSRLEFAVDGTWQEATLEALDHRWGWQRWQAQWDASAGTHELACRATDAHGNIQPLAPVWDAAGFGNNSVQRVGVIVR